MKKPVFATATRREFKTGVYGFLLSASDPEPFYSDYSLRADYPGVSQPYSVEFPEGWAVTPEGIFKNGQPQQLWIMPGGKVVLAWPASFGADKLPGKDNVAQLRAERLHSQLAV